MASSLDLSGFFEDEEVSQRRIRFTSTHPPKDAFDKIESSATELGFQVQRGHSKVCTSLSSSSSYYSLTGHTNTTLNVSRN
jgi:hypothetical protein